MGRLNCVAVRFGAAVRHWRGGRCLGFRCVSLVQDTKCIPPWVRNGDKWHWTNGNDSGSWIRPATCRHCEPTAESFSVLNQADAAKAEAASARQWRTAAPKRTATQFSRPNPASASFAANLRCCSIKGVAESRLRLLIIGFAVPISTPVPDIPRHVMQSERRHPPVPR